MTAGDAVPSHLDLPDHFDINHADRGDRVTADDGTTWVVIHPSGESKTLVHADIVDYGRFDHPLVAGLGGMAWLLFSFLAPPAGAYYLAVGASTLVAAAYTAGGVGLGYFLSNLVLYRTPIGAQVYRFLEWNEYKSTILAMRQADVAEEVAA